MGQWRRNLVVVSCVCPKNNWPCTQNWHHDSIRGLTFTGEPGMSPLRLEEEVNTALNSGQTYRQVRQPVSIATHRQKLAAKHYMHNAGKP